MQRRWIDVHGVSIDSIEPEPVRPASRGALEPVERAVVAAAAALLVFEFALGIFALFSAGILWMLLCHVVVVAGAAAVLNAVQSLQKARS